MEDASIPRCVQPCTHPSGYYSNIILRPSLAYRSDCICPDPATRCIFPFYARLLGWYLAMIHQKMIALFSGFHHPVKFCSHFVSLRNRTEPTRTGASVWVPTVNYSISSNLRSRLQKLQSIDWRPEFTSIVEPVPSPYRPVPTRTNPYRHPIYTKNTVDCSI